MPNGEWLNWNIICLWVRSLDNVGWKERELLFSLSHLHSEVCQVLPSTVKFDRCYVCLERRVYMVGTYDFLLMYAPSGHAHNIGAQLLCVCYVIQVVRSVWCLIAVRRLQVRWWLQVCNMLLVLMWRIWYLYIKQWLHGIKHRYIDKLNVPHDDADENEKS